MRFSRWIGAAWPLSMLTPPILFLDRVLTKHRDPGLSQAEVEQEMARAILPTLTDCQGLAPETRRAFVQILLEREVLPGAGAEHADPDNFEALLRLVTEKAALSTSA